MSPIKEVSILILEVNQKKGTIIPFLEDLQSSCKVARLFSIKIITWISPILINIL